MRYPNTIAAEFIDRPNRFIAHVRIDGRPETVHVKNTGRCRELMLPGAEVFLSLSDNPARKTRYDLIAVRRPDGVLFNIDSQAPNAVVKEWLQVQGVRKIRPEYSVGDSRIDFYLEHFDESGAPWKMLMEVKGCTLEREGVGYFPDAPTERGVKHLRELIRATEEGYRSAVAFVMQSDNMKIVVPNRQTHPAFAEALEEAERAGVKILCLPCHVEPDRLEIAGGILL